MSVTVCGVEGRISSTVKVKLQDIILTDYKIGAEKQFWHGLHGYRL